MMMNGQPILLHVWPTVSQLLNEVNVSLNSDVSTCLQYVVCYCLE